MRLALPHSTDHHPLYVCHHHRCLCCYCYLFFLKIKKLRLIIDLHDKWKIDNKNHKNLYVFFRKIADNANFLTRVSLVHKVRVIRWLRSKNESEISSLSFVESNSDSTEHIKKCFQHFFLPSRGNNSSRLSTPSIDHVLQNVFGAHFRHFNMFSCSKVSRSFRRVEFLLPFKGRPSQKDFNDWRETTATH